MVLGLALMEGCAPLDPASGRPYANGPPGPISPLDVEAPPAAPPPAISRVDVEVAKLIRRTLKEDYDLAAVSGNVRVSVDRGVVTLRGSVPAARDRDEIANRIVQLPGVDRVENLVRVVD